MRWGLAALAVLVIGAAIRVQTGPGTPTAVRQAAREPAAPRDRGRDVYRRYGCAMCHGIDGKGGHPNPNAETDGKVPGVIYVAEGYTKAELRQRLLDGMRTIGRADPTQPAPPFRMPGWRDVMSNRELDDLIEYLWSFYPQSAEQKWR